MLAAGEVPATGGEVRSWHGEVLYEAPVGALEERYGASVSLHRADLQATLLSALPDDAVQLGAACVGFEQDAAGVTVRFADRREERSELLIGADGLNSTIRAQLFGDEKPRYAGYTAWHGVVETGEEFVRDGLGFESWGRGTRSCSSGTLKKRRTASPPPCGSTKLGAPSGRLLPPGARGSWVGSGNWRTHSYAGCGMP